MKSQIPKFLNSQIRKFANSYSPGQVALVILAIMAIGTTLALSLSQRAVSDVQISELEEESAKSFSAAEAGIEEALRSLEAGEAGTVVINPEELGVSNVDVSVTEQGGGEQFLYPTTLQPGETAVIWLRDHTDDGRLDEDSGYDQTSIKLCWQDEAAVEVIYFYRNASSQYQIKKYALDPNGTRAGDNGFTTGTEIGVCSDISDLNHSYQVDLSAGTPLFLAVRPFYQATQIGVVAAGGASLPAQGHLITSSGSVARGEQDVTRKIKVFRSWNSPSQPLFHVIFGCGISGD